MATIAQVREALAAAVEVTGLECKAHPKDLINPPVAHIMRPAFDPRVVFSGARQRLLFKIRVYVKRAAEAGGDELLDEYCDVTGQRSVYAAVQNGDNWPDDLIHYAEVQLIGETGIYETGGVQYLGAEIDVEVAI
jgi:hypothetical protein